MMTAKDRYAELSARYQRRSEAAYDRYQVTGLTRHYREYHDYLEMAEALGVAASASDDHDTVVRFRNYISNLAVRAAAALHNGNEDAANGVLRELIMLGRDLGAQLVYDREVTKG